MNTRQVRSLLAVVQHGSISKAAQALHLAPSSISSQLKELNTELGVTLFEPKGRNIVLSDIGESLLPDFQSFCAQETHIKNLAQDASRKLTGTLSIFAPSSMCIYRLPALIQKMQKRAPNVEVLLVHEPYDYCTALDRGDIDAAVLVVDKHNLVQGLSKDWEYQWMHEEEVVFVAHPELHENEILALDEVNQKALITTEPECTYRQHAEKHFQGGGVSLSVRQNFSNVEVIKKCVLGKMGFGLLPRCTVEEELASQVLREQHVKGLPYGFQSLLVYPKRTRQSEKLSVLLDILKDG